MPLKMPLAQLAAGFIDDPVANGNNQPGFFRQGEKLVRRQQPLLGCCQRSSASNQDGRLARGIRLVEQA